MELDVETDAVDCGKEKDEKEEDTTEVPVPDVLVKFRTYRQDAETNKKELKEAQAVIVQLKNEINVSRNLENNLRSQVSSAQNRCIQLQASLSKLVVLLERQKQNEKVCQQVEQKTEELNTLIVESRQRAENLWNKVSKQQDLAAENEELKFALKAKESDLDLAKLEIELLGSEKCDMKAQYEKKLDNLEDELKKYRSEYKEVKSYCDATLMSYRKQIEEKDKIIMEYEKERKSLLEEFEPDENPRNGDTFTKTDNTVFINTEERRLGHRTDVKEQEKESEDDEEADLFQEIPKVSSRKRDSSQRSGTTGKRPKPQLDFLIQSQQERERSQNSLEVPPKRRLFSLSNNYYED